MSWSQYLQDKLIKLDKQTQLRALQTTENGCDTWINKHGKRLLNLASNNYLGLAGDYRLIEAAQESAIYGAGATASRLIVGNHPLYEEAEHAIATWKETEGALLVGSGYMANVGALAALLSKDDVVYSDRLNHASITDGIMLSRARHRRYRHNDMNHLEQLLQQDTENKRKLIVTDTVFSMDGDTAYLHDLVYLKEKYGAFLMVDEAHASGIYGTEGAGLGHAFRDGIDLHMGTCSKALGCSGAYLAGSKGVIDYLLNTMRPFIFTTGMMPSAVGTVIRAIEIVRTDTVRREALLANSELLRKELNEAGVCIGTSTTQIVPIIAGSNEAAVRWACMLQEAGIAAVAIRPPTVPEHTSRVRLTVTAEHTVTEIKWAVQQIKAVLWQDGVLI
ncbi:8-amino-7-oxononanoate synthase [Ectobacillus sp. JY-23]|uniref:8-amino-7-oxononanoate synthase n=1 Tax=Ectobacillus sp. JY-23 TaxID=2933872 RepID=UPI001FF2BBC8|nr:8-amino-7-oxononanoate synthase [Ectobacillus sp. JY-23]UOY93893.1 8-amino-7-oxononanoate synthase [Ectobacillus sp. JY-23]